MNIAFVVDKGYITYLDVTIYSILKHNQHQQITFWVIKNGHFDTLTEVMNQLQDSFNFEIHYIDSLTENSVYGSLYRPVHISTAAFNKFKIPTLLPESIDKVLYLDCDIIVQGDIEALFAIDISKYYLAAVLDGDENYAKKVGLSEKDYFNSGVMLLNLNKLREIGLEQQAIEFLNSDRNPQQTSDQDAFNVVVAGNWLQLSDEWNYMMHKLYYWKIHSKVEPKIIHYTINEKPWSILSDSPMKELYIALLQEMGLESLLVNQFELFKNNPVYIYTASNGAKVVSELLNNLSINFAGFIDKNKQNESFLNKPVYGIEKLEEDIIVVNASLTYATEIKKILESKGFKKSVFSNKVFKKG